MKTAGIVAEYNPFHSGHAFHIAKTREAGFTHIVAVMSGNYTQRGEPAILRKEARCRAALRGGADLVLELPLPYAVSSAERFARGAVSLLNALGCCDAVSFGSECGDIALLERCAELIDSLQGHPELRTRLKTGQSFPSARAAAARAVAAAEASDADLAPLSAPNDTLGIEYIKSLRAIGSGMTPFTIPRAFAAHDGDRAAGGFASASYIRDLLRHSRFAEAEGYLPREAADIYNEELLGGLAPVNYELYGQMALAQLRRLSPAEIAKLPDVTEGLEHRLCRAVRSSASFEAFLQSVKTRRYTLSRIRRIALAGYLGIGSEAALRQPPYLRILGFNARGLQILKRAKQTAILPIVTRYAQISTLGETARRYFAAECLGTDLYALLQPRPQLCGAEQRLSALNLAAGPA